ncbi:MAG: efflux RND transporter permease subunit [Myxococcota bacterium]
MSMNLAARIASAIESLVGRLVGRPWVALGIVLTLAGGAAVWGKDIPIRSDMEDLFPEDSPNVVRAMRAREVLGSRSELQILIGSPDRALNREVGAEIAGTLEGWDSVRGVEFRRDVSFFEDNALLFLPMEDLRELHDEVDEAIKDAVSGEMRLDTGFELDEEPEPAPGDEAADGEESRLPTEAELRGRYEAQDLSEYFESPDGEVIAVKAYPRFKPADVKHTKALMERVRGLLSRVEEEYAGRGLSTAVEGDYTQLTAAVDQISGDLTRASALAIALITIILVLWFRRFRAVVLVLLPLAVGIAWTLLFARLAIGYLNLITAFIFAILLGLGIDFAVHAGSRADEEHATGLPLDQALPRALAGLGRAMVAAALTTTSTFLALTVFDFRGFSQFGAIAAAGVLLCLLAVYVTMPPLAMAMHHMRRRPRRRHSRQRGPGGPGRRLALAVLVGFVGLTGLAATQLDRLAFESDMSKMKTEVSRETSGLRKKYRREAETRAPSPALVIADDREDARKVHRKMDGYAADHRILEDVLSIWTFVPDRQEDKLELIREIRRKLKMKYALFEGQQKEDADRLMEYLHAERFGVDDLPEWVKEKFTDTEGNLGRYVLLYTQGGKSDAKHVLRIQDAVGTVEVDGRVYHSTASYYISGDAYQIVREEGPWAVGLAALVVLLLLLVDLRDLRDLLLAFVPLAIGFVLFLGTLVLLGIQLNLFNVVVLPTILGIGVDTSIHLVHRIREEGDDLWLVLRTTGGAAAISSLTTAAGFFGMTVISNEGLRTIGWVAVVGILVIFVTCVALTLSLASLGLRKPAE